MLVEHPTADQVVISATLQSEYNAAVALSTVTSGDFKADMHQLIFKGVERAMLSSEPYDIKLVSESITQIMREGKKKSKLSLPPGMLESLAGNDTSRWMGYLETVKRMSVYRKAQNFSEWMNNEIEGYADMTDLYPKLVERIEELNTGKMTDAITMGNDTMPLYAGVLARRQQLHSEGKGKVFDWPWPSWNRNVRPLRPGLAGIIAGPDGQGKSSALEQVAEHWAKQWQVVMVHCENDIEYTLDRRAARLSGVDIHIIESGNYTPSQKADLDETRYPWFNNLHYVDGGGKTADQIISEITALRGQGKCDAVVLDYLNKVRPSRGQSTLYAGRSYEVTGDNMERFKSAAVKGGWPLMTATQMTKGAQESAKMGDRLTRDKMRGSGEISEKVQLVAILSREILDNDILAPNGQPIFKAGEYGPRTKWRIDKQNRGRTLDFEQQFIGRRFMFQDYQNV